MWGYSLQFWQIVLKVALVVAAGAGALSVAAGFLGAFLGYRVAELAKTEADRRVAEVQASVGEARADATKAKEAAAELQARSRSLEQELSASRREAESLQARVASRFLSDTQEEKLVSVLRERGDRPVEISVRVQSSDPETAQYASDLADVLSAAGLGVHRSMALRPDPPAGLLLGAPIDSVDFELIKRAFVEAGITLEFAGIVPALTLYVGPKSLVIE